MNEAMLVVRSEYSVYPYSSIIEVMPRVLFHSVQSQCQQHYKYQGALNGLSVFHLKATLINSPVNDHLLLTDIKVKCGPESEPKALERLRNCAEKCPNPLKSWSSILWPRNSKNSTKAGLSSMFPNSSSSDVCQEGNKVRRSVWKSDDWQKWLTKCTYLAKLLVNNSEFEVVADYMLIKGDNEPWCLWTKSFQLVSQCWWREERKQQRGLMQTFG